MHKRQEKLQQQINKLIDSVSINQKIPLHKAIEDLQQVNLHSNMIDIPQQKLYIDVDSLLPMQKIQRYRELKKKQENNDEIIRVVQRGRAVTTSMEKLINDDYSNIDESYYRFAMAVQCLNEFQQLNLSGESGINFSTLRQQFYQQLLGKIIKAIQQSDSYSSRFKKILIANNLPLKKDETRQVGLGQEDRLFILGILYRENCFFTIRHYLQGLLQLQHNQSDGDTILREYWSQSIKKMGYLFIDNEQLHNLEEPGWMLEYAQLILNGNYRYLLEFICIRGLRQEIISSLSRHFLNGTYLTFLRQVIQNRLQEDLPNLNDFLLFNFLDELGKFQDKLATSFGVRPGLVEMVLIRFDGSRQILGRCLEYEQKWFQSKIYEDFINIDYSRINLKNLDAYNIVGNFLSLFQRLHRKFSAISHPSFRPKIISFYQKQVLQVVAQVKTSFDRIYSHSRLPKIDVLLSFKRIENDMRASLSGFFQNQPYLQDTIQREYHNFLQKYFQVCALQAVTPIHKKMHISLGEMMAYLCQDEEEEHQKYLSAFGKIYEEWENRMEQILKFAAYTDLKIRGIFFKYLQATNFSSVGLNLYLKIFQPYLRFILTEDRHRVLLAMITMQKEEFQEYVETHADSLVFLTGEQRKQLQVFKRTAIIE